MYKYFRYYLVILAIFICIFFVGSCDRREATVEQTYRQLSYQMQRDIEGNVKYSISSKNEYLQHKNYKKLISIGKPIVKLIFEDIQSENYRSYHTILIEEIVTDVNFDILHGNQKWRHDSYLRKKYWLEWWDREGRIVYK